MASRFHQCCHASRVDILGAVSGFFCCVAYRQNLQGTSIESDMKLATPPNGFFHRGRKQ